MHTRHASEARPAYVRRTSGRAGLGYCQEPNPERSRIHLGRRPTAERLASTIRRLFAALSSNRRVNSVLGQGEPSHAFPGRSAPRFGHPAPANVRGQARARPADLAGRRGNLADRRSGFSEWRTKCEILCRIREYQRFIVGGLPTLGFPEAGGLASRHFSYGAEWRLLHSLQLPPRPILRPKPPRNAPLHSVSISKRTTSSS